MIRRIIIAILYILIESTAIAQEMSEQPPLIPIDKFLPNKTLPQYKSSKLLKASILGGATLPTQLNLLNYLGVKGAERNQGSCGSCWVWSGIGCLEGQFNKNLADEKFSGSNYVQNQKFSINFVEAKAQKHKELINGGNSICDGGRPEWLVDLLQTSDGYNYLVPKTNRNAEGTFSGLSSDTNNIRNINRIQTTPHVNLNKIILMDVVSNPNNYEQAKQDIMQALKDGYFVQLDYLVYNDFYTFWKTKNEDVQYYFPNVSNDPCLGGHAVIIVGYDTSDEDPNNHYWIVQNSWGTSAKRPNGLFRVNINSALSSDRVVEYVIYKTTYGIEEETCDNLDNDCNTVADDDCNDECPYNGEKTVPGICGCDASDLDTDFDGIPDCFDGCPEDPTKIEPEMCGCGIPESQSNLADDDYDGVVNCQEDDFLKFRDVKFGVFSAFTKKYNNKNFSLNFLCTRSVSNELWCMGNNSSGQLGDGTKENKSSLVKLNGLSNVSSYSLGLHHSCAISDSRTYCWGWNNLGELGQNNNAYSLNPTEISLEINHPLSVTCGYDASCVTTLDGHAYCFGANDGGKLGVNGKMHPEISEEEVINGNDCVPDNEYWNDFSGIDNFNGTMATVPLSGITGMAMSALETATISDGVLYNYGIHHNMRKHTLANRYDEFNNLIAVSKSETDLCAINSSGDLYCLDTFISTNDDPRDDYSINKINLSNVEMVSCGSKIFDTVSLSNDINNRYGLCCNIDNDINNPGNTTNHCYKRPYSTDEESHVCAVSNGKLYCWGRGNSYGQLGSYRTVNLNVPTKVEGISNVTALAASGGTTCYISSGNLYCFGDLTPLGINRQGPEPYLIQPEGTTVADFINIGSHCNYKYDGNDVDGEYAEVNGKIVCKPLANENNEDTCINDCPGTTPTATQTETPTEAPSTEPTEVITPNESPTVTPTEDSTPTKSPAATPTEVATPTESPTTKPTEVVTPTKSPTTKPAEDTTPNETPTSSPTETTTSVPTTIPTTEAPSVEPTVTPTICPKTIETSISATKVTANIIKIKMGKIDRKCFKGRHIYQVKIANRGKINKYTTSNSTFTTKKLRKGQYKLSYRVVEKTATKGKRFILRPVSRWSKTATVKIRKK